MKTVMALVFVAVVAFYVAWPAYSVLRIKNALEAEDSALLAAKVDFPSVQESLKLAVTVEVEKRVAAQLSKAGGANEALFAQIKGQMVPPLVNAALAVLVSPESAIRLYRERADLAKAIAAIVSQSEGVGGGALAALAAGFAGGGNGKTVRDLVGGLAGQATAAEKPAPPPGETTKQPMGLANIKSFALSGPAMYTIGLARKQEASAPDVTVDIAFTNFDWRVVGVHPNL